MMTNKEKTLTLLSLLDHQKNEILNQLPEELSSFLNAELSQFESKNILNQKKVIEELMILRSQYAPKLPIPAQPGIQEETAVAEDTVEVEPDTNKYHLASELLVQEKPQIIAFFLSKLEEVDKNQLLALLPKKLTETISNMEIEYVPISEKIFSHLYSKIFGTSEN